MSLNMEQIQQTLDVLLNNHAEINRRFWDVFYDPVPRDVDVQMYDEDGTLQTYSIPNRAKLTRWYQSMHVPPRNSILYGRIDALGAPAHLILSGGAVELDASPTMLLLNFAAGMHETGPVDHIAMVAADHIWSGLPVSSTCWLYADRDAATGDISYGHTVLEPVQAKIAPAAPAEGQHWYDSHAGRMLVYSGGTWSEVQRISLGSCVTDGSGAVTEVYPAPIGLAMSEADFGALLDRMDSRPVTALPYPEVCNSDYRIAVSGAAATAGGVVTVAGGEEIVIGESTAEGMGRLRSLVVPGYVSDDLTANATYYLRGQVQDGTLLLYLQQGGDSDPIPVALVGTPGAGAGGGFDSSRLDVLAAKIVTGGAGTSPTVTRLANAQHLRVKLNFAGYLASVAADGVANHAPDPVALGWARTPVALPSRRQTNATNGTTSLTDIEILSATRSAVQMTFQYRNFHATTRTAVDMLASVLLLA